jgi:hypothetical protein
MINQKALYQSGIMVVSKKANANVVMSCIISPCGKTAAKRGIEVGGKIEMEKVSVLYREG